MPADALTVQPSKAELQVAYYRKILIALAPVLLAGFRVIRDAADTGAPLTAVTYGTAVLAVGQALLTYFPSNAVAKMIGSGLCAVGSGLIAAASDGVTLSTSLMILTQLLAWIGSSAIENGPRPDVALAQGRGEHGDAGLPQ